MLAVNYFAVMGYYE